MPTSDPIVSSVKQVRKGKSIQDEGESRLRQLLPNASQEELERVSTAITKLIDDVSAQQPVPEPAPQANGKKSAKANGKRTNGKSGKKFKRDKILRKFLALKVQPYTSPELADAVGLPSAQPLSPLLTSLKRNGAMKRRKARGEITWTPVRSGLRQYIKQCEQEAA